MLSSRKSHERNQPAILCSLMTALLIAVGCQPSPEDRSAEEPEPQATVSDVPLRILVVGDLSDPVLLKRQWLAGSDQEIAIEAVSVDDFLGREGCESEVVLFPSRLVGDAVSRGWISKLPDAVTELSEDDEQQYSSDLAAEAAQSLHDGEPYAVTLGLSIPAVIASDAMAEKLGSEPLGWDAVLTQVAAVTDEDTGEGVGEVEIDFGALTDRFLAVVAGKSDRNPAYGLLFEMQSMTSRLKGPEFLSAMTVLQTLSRQAGGLPAILGSHDQAWKWAAANDAEVIAIAVPALLGAEAVGITGGAVIDVNGTAASSHWNTGGGLVAALSADCRQSAQAVEFLKWLRERQTRGALAPILKGVESATITGGTDSLAAKARQNALPARSSMALPHEPSLPGAERYRKALGQKLADFLTGKKSAEEALSEAATEWDKITEQFGASQRTEYEKSLGLTL